MKIPTFSIIALIMLLLVPLSCCIDEGPDVRELEYVNDEGDYFIYELYSNEVSDEFKIYVRVPESFDPNNKYPIVYLLDADWFFDDSYRIDNNGVRGMVYNLENGGIMPPTVLVGIGYAESNERARDFGQYPENFYYFLKYEISDFLEDEIGLDLDSEKTLIGYSSAGLFSFYALFRGDLYFDNYVMVSSPIYSPLYGVEKALLSDELSFYNRFRDTFLDIKIFMAVGGDEEERFTSSHEDMVSRINAKEYKGLSLEDRIYYGKNHTSIVFDAFIDALAWLFSDIDDIIIY
ncbi:MAG TPA: alpha/beta hydrolase-fold protein [Candidatus Methanofastidiosa archaeon]|nr:alpha/beta hydrolase-fold protein [Candidatus Methanofastidiosa archaeon]